MSSGLFSSFEVYMLWGIPMSLLWFGVLVAILGSKNWLSLLCLGLYAQITTNLSPFSLFVASLFFFIFTMNMVSLIPASFPVSSLLAVTLFYAFMFWSANYLMTFMGNKMSNVAHFLPVGTPSFLVILLVWIELASWLARPLALSVRLMANITAGHLLLGLLSTSVLGLFTSIGIIAGLISLSVFMFMVFLELAVGFIQAYVFSLLVSLYISESLGE